METGPNLNLLGTFNINIYTIFLNIPLPNPTAIFIYSLFIMKTKQVKRRKTKTRRKTRKTWKTGGASIGNGENPSIKPSSEVTNPLLNDNLEQSEPTAVNKPLVNVSKKNNKLFNLFKSADWKKACILIGQLNNKQMDYIVPFVDYYGNDASLEIHQLCIDIISYLKKIEYTNFYMNMKSYMGLHADAARMNGQIQSYQAIIDDKYKKLDGFHKLVK